MLKAICFLSLIGFLLLQLQQECTYASVVPSLQKSTKQLEKLQEVYYNYLFVLETSLAKENDPQLYESGLQFLAALDKKIEDLKTINQLKARNYWRSRHGRK